MFINKKKLIAAAAFILTLATFSVVYTPHTIYTPMEKAAGTHTLTNICS